MSAMRITLNLILLGCLFLGILAAPSNKRALEESDPELTAGYYQGDMEIDLKRNGLRSELARWPNATVYYKIDEEFDVPHATYIELAMRHIESVSCIRFLPASDDTLDYVLVTVSQKGCNSEVGYQGGEQNLKLTVDELDSGCFELGVIQHEFLHTLGFFHQQSASNRDEYVKIVMENIIPDMDYNFFKYGEDLVSGFDEAYDYGSIMHYSPTAFSKNKKATIIALHPEGEALMGQREKLSPADINRLNKMYKCPMQM